MPSATELRAAIAVCTEDAAWCDAHNRPRMARLYRRLARELLALLD